MTFTVGTLDNSPLEEDSLSGDGTRRGNSDSTDLRSKVHPNQEPLQVEPPPSSRHHGWRGLAAKSAKGSMLHRRAPFNNGGMLLGRACAPRSPRQAGLKTMRVSVLLVVVPA